MILVLLSFVCEFCVRDCVSADLCARMENFVSFYFIPLYRLHGIMFLIFSFKCIQISN